MPSSSSNDNYKTSRDYELLVHKMIKQEMSGITGVKDLEILHNVKIKGLSGYEHQIDVVYRFKIWKTEILVIVECKQYNKMVGVDDLLEFKSRIEDIKAHKGIFVTSLGFQSGAICFAEANRIALLVVMEEPPVEDTILADLAFPHPDIFFNDECQFLVKLLCDIYETTITGYNSRITIDKKRNVVIVKHAGAKIVLEPYELDFILMNKLSKKVNRVDQLFCVNEDISTTSQSV